MAWKAPWQRGAHADADNDIDDTEAQTDADALSARVDELAAENEQLRTDLNAATAERDALKAENDTLKASNEQLTTDLTAAQDATASQQVSALEQAQDAAHAAAVRAFGQGSAKLEQAEADIALCESVREAGALERAYKAAEPKGLSAPVRQTAAQKAQTAGKTSVRATEPTEEERAAAARSVQSSF